ncbi:MAG TPA: D-alanyl-D-alanine carboxypeptidase family protein [Thermodesulfovibrionales bacterium]|nr:D-alanyl-D-alanine carboxypeptidase family protein [Thermodesulfovibrionales bacterium]
MKHSDQYPIGGSREKKTAGKGILLLCFAVCFLLLASAAHADDIHSRAAIVIEASTGRVLYGKNPNLRLPPASTTKLMTAMVALDRLDVNDVVTISERAANVSPVKAHFRAGEKVTVRTLLYAALLKSANDAAVALAEAAGGTEEKFAELMNQKVLALGMSDTKFINATGLPGNGQYSTVYDLSRMMRNSLRYPLIREIINTKASSVSTEAGRTIFLKNINKLLWEDDSLLGGKTGYTRAAKHCFVCAGLQDDETIIVAVMGAPSRETLWKESGSLLARGFTVRNSQEEPSVYFTRSDYRPALERASYNPDAPQAKKASYKKAEKKSGKKAKGKKKTKTKHYATEQTRAKNADVS